MAFNLSNKHLRFTSKDMMKFWTRFAKNGKPGVSSNGVEWIKYNGQKNELSNYIILDNRKILKCTKMIFLLLHS